MNANKMNQVKTEEPHGMLSFQYVAEATENPTSWNLHQMGIICSIVLATFAALTFPYFFISLPIALIAMAIGFYGLGDSLGRRYAVLGILLSLAVSAVSVGFVALLFVIGIPS